jgi:hypothetical protein
MSAAPAAVGSTATAAVEASTAMGSTAPMEAAAAVEAFTTMEATAAVIESAATGVPVAVPVVAAVVIATPASVVAVSATAIVAVVPRAGADKDATDEVVGTVKAIRCASVGVVAIVSIRTNRSRADSDANGNLSMGVACGKHENAK